MRGIRDGPRLAALLVLTVGAVLGACSPAPAAAPASSAAAGAPAPTAAPPAAKPAAGAPAAVQPLSPAVSMKGGSTRLIGEAAIFDAIEKGYFREEGIDVELIPFRAGGEMTASLATGELAFASFGLDPSLFNAVARGIPLRVVAYNAIINTRDTSGSWIVRQDHLDSGRGRDVADLRGLAVGINGLNGVGQVLLERILARGGLTVDDVQVSTIPFPDIPAAFANRAIDAGYLVEPFVSVAEGQGTARTVLASGEFFIPGTPVQVVPLSPVFAEQQPEAARRFLVAYLRGARDYIRTFVKREGGREEFDQILLKYTPIQDPRLFDRMATHDMDPNGVMDATVMNEIQDYFVRYGSQQQKVDLSQVIDPSYAEYAVSRLGRANP
jgi:NitT/TauT family transport system substrate-binding protein